MNIFLDDYRQPHHVTWQRLPNVVWTIVRNYDEFKDTLDGLKKAPDYVAFDHDLADNHYQGDFSDPNEKTGYDCAKYLKQICEDRGWEIPAHSCHSLNPVGKENILRYLNG